MNGVGKHTINSEAFSDYKRRRFQTKDMEEDLSEMAEKGCEDCADKD